MSLHSPAQIPYYAENVRFLVGAEKLAEKEFNPDANPTTMEVAGKVLDVAAAARIATPLDPSAYLEFAKVSKPSTGVSMSTPRSFMNPSAVLLSAAPSLSFLQRGGNRKKIYPILIIQGLNK